ncbi:MAG: DoxX family protein [Chloroflexi bacterium]|nr:DoxX family protein [Chloroflexota bacterium]OJV99743.1 MAG: hypothetical protein BGO39_12395 [Chloroflexi bacterium 54-19]
MGLVRMLARMCLSGIFIVGGYAAFSEPGQRPKRLQNVGLPESEELVKLNGATMIGAGITLGLGIFPRLSALALIGNLIPTTLAGHPFWVETDPKAREAQTIQFCKNLGLIGGLLLVAFEPKKKKEKFGETD